MKKTSKEVKKEVKKETSLIKMKKEDGHTAEVHPDMVDDYKKGGYIKV